MTGQSAAQQIDEIIRLHAGWKGDILTRLREVITATDASIVEEVKWKTPSRPEGLPVWTSGGIICFAEIWKDNISLLFPKGAYLLDQSELFNARLQSTELRAIKFHEGDTVSAPALKKLLNAAILKNISK